MLRSSRLSLALSLLCLAAVPVVRSADARSPERATVDSVIAPPQAPAAMAVVLALNSFTDPTMRFERTPTVDSVDAATFHVELWSPKTQAALQRSAFDKAFADTMRARDFSSGTFAGIMLDTLVDFAGPDNVIEAVKSYRPKAEQYRLLLRAISERRYASSRERPPQNTPSRGDSRTG